MSGDRERIRAAVAGALAGRAREAGVELTDATDLLGSGLVDSLAFVDLLLGVEEEIGVPLALELLDFAAVGDLGSLVDQLARLQASSSEEGAPSPSGSEAPALS
jgi:acyl carrier protein